MGVVAQFGPGAKAQAAARGLGVLGTRVVPLQWSSVPGGSGCYAEYVVAEVDDCVVVPDSVIRHL
jgi:NADPH:quinone reductase-like Zn-dependent oxidoreductase